MCFLPFSKVGPNVLSLFKLGLEADIFDGDRFSPSRRDLTVLALTQPSCIQTYRAAVGPLCRRGEIASVDVGESRTSNSPDWGKSTINIGHPVKNARPQCSQGHHGQRISNAMKLFMSANLENLEFLPEILHRPGGILLYSAASCPTTSHSIAFYSRQRPLLAFLVAFN